MVNFWRSVALAGVLWASSIVSVPMSSVSLGPREATAREAESVDDYKRKVTPEKYKKDSNQHWRDLIGLISRFDGYSDKDRKTAVDILIQNISLQSRDMFNDASRSETIREYLSLRGVLDFEKRIEKSAERIEQYKKGYEATKVFYDSNATNLIVKDSAKKHMENFYGLIQAEKEQAKLNLEAMLVFRWHAPKSIEKEIDFKEAMQKHREAFDAYNALSTALDNKRYDAIDGLLDKCRTVHKKASELFLDDINGLLDQAEVNIGMNLKYPVLAKIYYNGKTIIVPAGFVSDWKDAEKAFNKIKNSQVSGIEKIVSGQEARLVIPIRQNPELQKDLDRFYYSVKDMFDGYATVPERDRMFAGLKKLEGYNKEDIHLIEQRIAEAEKRQNNLQKGSTEFVQEKMYIYYLNLAKRRIGEKKSSQVPNVTPQKEGIEKIVSGQEKRPADLQKDLDTLYSCVKDINDRYAPLEERKKLFFDIERLKKYGKADMPLIKQRIVESEKRQRRTAKYSTAYNIEKRYILFLNSVIATIEQKKNSEAPNVK